MAVEYGTCSLIVLLVHDTYLPRPALNGVTIIVLISVLGDLIHDPGGLLEHQFGYGVDYHP